MMTGTANLQSSKGPWFTSGASSWGLGQYSNNFNTPEENVGVMNNAGAFLREKEKNSSDQSIARMNNDTNRFNAQLQYDASVLPANQKQDRFNQVFPWLQGQMGNLWGGGGFGNFGAPGGQSPAGPTFDTNPIFGVGQQQQMFNAQRASNDRRTANTTRTQQQGLAARGQGPGSALAMSLAGRNQAANLAANTSGRRDLALQVAPMNKEFQQKGRALQEQQRASMADEDIKRRTPYLQGLFGTGNSLISALGSLV